MFPNMFWFDPALRGPLGVVMLILAYVGSQVLLAVGGGILLVTAVVGFCPLVALAARKDRPKPGGLALTASIGRKAEIQ